MSATIDIETITPGSLTAKQEKELGVQLCMCRQFYLDARELRVPILKNGVNAGQPAISSEKHNYSEWLRNHEHLKNKCPGLPR